MTEVQRMGRKALTIGIVLSTVLWSMMATALLAPFKVQAGGGCTSGSLVKGSLAAVYYCGADGKRYVFTNDKAYFTWYSNFNNITTLSASALADIAIGGNVTYRPGMKMIKIQSDPRTYVVAHGGTLRHVGSEAVAACLYGSTWNQQIDDISDAFFVNYEVGAQVATCTDYNKSAELSASLTINMDLGLQASGQLSVTSTAPASGSTNVSLTGDISASLNGSVDASTANTSTFTLMKGSTSVAGSVSASGNTLTFNPSASLEANTTYTATVTTQVKDSQGRSLSSNYSWTFTTSASGQPGAPTVTAISPPDGAANVALGTEISATFSEAMDASTLNSSTFTLTKAGASVAGTVSYSGNKVTFNPSASLQTNSTYTVTVTGGAKDLEGNAVSGGSFSWNFTTVP